MEVVVAESSKPKDCPRCSGHMAPMTGEQGPFVNCINCGYDVYPDQLSLEELVEEEARYAGKRHWQL